MAKPTLKLVEPPTADPVNVLVRTPRRPNDEIRTREYLTPAEIEALLKAAKEGRWGQRDHTMLLVAYRHGLRAAEVCDLRWDQIDFDAQLIHVRRVKHGTPAVHPMEGDESRALRELRRAHPEAQFVFVNERKTPFKPTGFARLVERIGERAALPFSIHPHMLRHACGFKLANDGHPTRHIQTYLGHRNIQHTARYTELSAGAYKDFWRVR